MSRWIGLMSWYFRELESVAEGDVAVLWRTDLVAAWSCAV